MNFYAELLKRDQANDKCEFCGGSGVILMQAEQCYSSSRGTYIRNEYEAKCSCTYYKTDSDEAFEQSREY